MPSHTLSTVLSEMNRTCHATIRMSSIRRHLFSFFGLTADCRAGQIQHAEPNGPAPWA